MKALGGALKKARCHSRGSGNPAFLARRAGGSEMDSRFRGNDAVDVEGDLAPEFPAFPLVTLPIGEGFSLTGAIRLYFKSAFTLTA
jgi:hypothetical protein